MSTFLKDTGSIELKILEGHMIQWNKCLFKNRIIEIVKALNWYSFFLDHPNLYKIKVNGFF